MRQLTIAKKSIGIDVSGRSVKGVAVSRRGSSVVIKNCVEVPVPQANGERPQPEQIAAALEELRKRLKVGSELVVSSIPTQQATVRNLEIPFSEETKARQILKFQTEPYLAFPIEEVIVDFYDTETAPEGKMRVLLTAIHKGAIGEHLKLVSMAQIEPEVVDVDFMAVASAAVWSDPQLREGAAMIMDVGISRTIACYVQEGKLLAVRCISVGGDDFTEADRGQAELDRTVRYFTSQVRGARFDRVILCGESASLPGLDTLLREALSAEVSVLSPSDAVVNKSGDEVSFARFATAFGLALRGVGESIGLQNFRQEEHAYPRPFRRLKKSLVVSGALAIGIVALLVFNLFASLDRYQSMQSDLNQNIQIKRATIFLGKRPTSNTEMEKLLEEETSKLTPLRQLRENVSTLDALLDLSNRIPEDMKAEVSYFHYLVSATPATPAKSRRGNVRLNAPSAAATITMRGTVSSGLDVTRLREIMEKSGYFSEVESKGSVTQNERVTFEFILRLKESRY